MSIHPCKLGLGIIQNRRWREKMQVQVDHRTASHGTSAVVAPKEPRCADPALGLVVMARLNQRCVGRGLLLSDSTTRKDQRQGASAARS